MHANPRAPRRTRRAATGVRRSAALAVVLGLLSCTDTVTTVVPVSHLELQPASAAVDVGATTQLTAHLSDASGDDVSGRQITWKSDDPALAAVDGSGVVRGVAPGSTTIRARAEGVEGTAHVVVNGSRLSVSPAAVDFHAVAGASSAGSEDVHVSAAGDAPLSGIALTIDYDGAGGWLSAALSSTTTPLVLTLRSTAASLPAGSYDATVSVTSPLSPDTGRIAAHLVVDPPPPAAPSDLAATAVGADRIDLKWRDNSDDETRFALERSAAGGAFQSVNDSLPPNTTTFSDTQLTAATAYRYRVRACSPSGCSAFSAEAGATTAALPSIHLATSAVSLSDTAGSTALARTSVAITNAGGGTLDGLAAAVHYAAGEPTGWLSASLSTPLAPATLTITATPGSLDAGTYAGSVEVASPVADGGSRSVSVIFTVAPAAAAPPPPEQPTISLGATTVALSATALGADPAPQTVAVDNGGTGTLDGLTTTVDYGGLAGGWLTATLDATTAPATLTLSAHTGLLLPGSYGATVTVASSVAGVSPATIAVTFDVAAAPAPSEPPAAPSNLSANATSSSTIVLTWSDNSADETRFRVERRDPHGDFRSIAESVPPDTESFTDSGLERRTDYEYRVQACNGAGCSSYSNTANAKTSGGGDHN